MSRVPFAYAACALIWGTTWYGIRVCLEGYPTFTALALRFLIATCVLVPLALRVGPWPRGKAWVYLVIAGVLDAGSYLLVYIGEERVPGGVAAVLYGTQPLLLAVLLAATRMEAITRRHIVGAIVSLAGVVVLAWDRFEVSPQQALGVVLVLGSVLVSTIYSMVMKRHSEGVHGLVSTTVFLGVTALVLGVVALAVGAGIPWPPPVVPTIALFYLAILGSVVAFLVYFWLLRATTLLLTSTLVFVYPLVALAIDAAFERAITLGPGAYVGAGITLAGLAVSLRRG